MGATEKCSDATTLKAAITLFARMHLCRGAHLSPTGGSYGAGIEAESFSYEQEALTEQRSPTIDGFEEAHHSPLPGPLKACV